MSQNQQNLVSCDSGCVSGAGSDVEQDFFFLLWKLVFIFQLITDLQGEKSHKNASNRLTENRKFELSEGPDLNRLCHF